jgi:hypothetical protein
VQCVATRGIIYLPLHLPIAPILVCQHVLRFGKSRLQPFFGEIGQFSHLSRAVILYFPRIEAAFKDGAWEHDQWRAILQRLDNGVLPAVTNRPML